MEGSSKTSVGAVSGLPDDLLVEILSRVPAKSVCRFKCVSKVWRDLIADPDHHKKLRQAMQGLFVETLEVSEVDYTKLASVSFSFIDLTVRSVPLDIDHSFSFLTKLTGIKTLAIVDSCNGFILLGDCQESSHLSAADYTYFVCNPTTKQWSAVPDCSSPEALSHTYLAFDPAVSSHFHLVQFQMRDASLRVTSLHVYSSETRNWSQNQIDEQKEQGQLEGWHHQFELDVHDYHCAFVNGFLHFIVWGSDRQHILVVDIQGKARRMITVPGMADGSQGNNITSYLGQSQGHLHCVTVEPVNKNEDKISTWVLQDYDTQEWVLKSTVNPLDVFGATGVGPDFEVVVIHQDCNVLFFFHHLTRKLIAYDMDHKEVVVISTFKDYKYRRDFARYIPYFSESLVLTNNH